MTVVNSLNYQLIYPERNSQLPLKKYLELMHFLLDILSDKYLGLHDQEFTHESLKLALHRDRSVNVGLHVLLQITLSVPVAQFEINSDRDWRH